MVGNVLLGTGKDWMCFGNTATLAKEQTRGGVKDWKTLHQWSTTDLGAFWKLVAQYTQIKWHTPPQQIYVPPKSGMLRGSRWFVGGKLNFSENLLLYANSSTILLNQLESNTLKETTGSELYDLVSNLASSFRNLGINK